MIEDPSTGAEQRSPEVTSVPAPESKPAPAAAPAQQPEGAKFATEVRAAKELEGAQAGKAGADPAPLVSAAGQDAPSSEGKEAKPASGPRRRTSKAKASEKKGSANKQDAPAKKKQAGQKAVSAKARPAGQQDGPVAEKPAEQVEPTVKKDPVEQKEAPVKVGPADQKNAPVAEKPVEQAEPSAKKEPAVRVDAPKQQESAEREEGAATTRPTAPDQAPADSAPVSQDSAAADVASAKPAPVKRTRTRNKSRGPASRKDDKAVSEKSKEDAAPEVVDAAVAVSQQEAAAPEVAPAPAPSRVRHHSVDEIDFDKAGVDELRDLAMHRRRGRPSPQKEEARQTILDALQNPTPESLEVARAAAKVLRGAAPRKKAPAPAPVVEASSREEKSKEDTQASQASQEGEAQAASAPATARAPAQEDVSSKAEASASQEVSEGYGSRRRRHDRRSETRGDDRAAQPRSREAGRDSKPSDDSRPQRPQQGKQQYSDRPDRGREKFEKKYGKNDRRDRNGRREREYVTGPSLSLEELAALAEEDLLAKADELSIAHDGVASASLVQAVYDEMYRQEGFFDFNGVLELSNDGSGIVRTKGYLASDSDLFMPAALIRINGLRRGDMLNGTAKVARPGEKRPGVCKISLVNGKNPEELRTRPRFGDLTPVFPSEPLRMEHGKDSILGRVIDLVAPIGKGQRGLIVSPPKAGKTTVLKKIAESISANNPEVHLICLLVDERPEEVTDMQRSIHGEVVASTFDMPCENHITVSELVIERAKRLVEQGEDVVILLDSITRLARAYNLAQPASGRILSGGVDSTALYPPKRFLGAARNIENGGSLTILASALVDTGSKMDEVIFEEFKGTGNMELKLDRDLADRRVFPAVDPVSSGTRKEELLLDPASAPLVWGVRRVLANMNNNERAMNSLIKALRATANNEEFLLRAAKKAQGNDYMGDL